MKAWRRENQKEEDGEDRVRPPFYRHKEGRSTCTGRSKVVVFSPNRGCAVDDYCRKYTVGYGAGRGSCPGWRPDSADITPASLWSLG